MQVLPMNSLIRDLRARAAARVEREDDLRVDFPGGSHLRIVHADGGATVHIVSSDAQPVLEYNTITGDVRIAGPLRRLELETTERELSLSSRGDIRLRAEGTVRLQGKAGVRMEATSELGKPASLVDVGPGGVTVAGHRLGAVAAEGHARIGRCDVTGDELRSTWSHAVHAAERLEFAARDMRTKVTTLIQTVEETMTTRAGRLREWVRGSRLSHAETTEITSDQDVRIDGTKIRLG